MFDTSDLSNACSFRKREELLQKQEQAWKLKGQVIEVTYDNVVLW